MVSLQNEILKIASLSCTLAGVCALLVESRRLFRRGLPLALDFWLAAGLLRLSATANWSAIGAAALIVLLRKVVGLALARLRAA